MIRFITLLLLPFFIAGLAFASEKKHDDHDHFEKDHFHAKTTHKKTIKAVAASGANILGDKVLWTFPEPWGQVTVISSGAWNNAGDEPLDLTSSTPNSALVVNKVDPVLSGFPNQFPQNIPLRDIPMFINADFERGDPVSVFNIERDQLSRSWPNDEITWGEWKQAKGRAKFECFDNGNAKVKIRLRNMIPNGLYTVWATSGTDEGGLTAVPFGGAPNVLVPDENGVAVWKRELNGCPFDAEGVKNPLLLLEIAYHSDNNIYGGVPDSAVTGLPFGLSTNTQVNIPITIVK